MSTPETPRMSSSELEEVYTLLCQALAQVGEPRASLLLATLSLDLLSRHTDRDGACDAIRKACELAKT